MHRFFLFLSLSLLTLSSAAKNRLPRHHNPIVPSVITDPATNDCYIVYHRRPLTTDHASQRQVCIDKLRFDKKGFIRPVKMTK